MKTSIDNDGNLVVEFEAYESMVGITTPHPRWLRGWGGERQVFGGSAKGSTVVYQLSTVVDVVVQRHVHDGDDPPWVFDYYHVDRSTGNHTLVRTAVLRALGADWATTYRNPEVSGRD